MTKTVEIDINDLPITGKTKGLSSITAPELPIADVPVRLVVSAALRDVVAHLESRRKRPRQREWAKVFYLIAARDVRGALAVNRDQCVEAAAYLLRRIEMIDEAEAAERTPLEAAIGKTIDDAAGYPATASDDGGPTNVVPLTNGGAADNT